MTLRSKVAAASCLTALVLAPAAAQAAKPSAKTLEDSVTVKRILTHERALASFAQRNGGTRASGTPGYTASSNYVAAQLRKAGYLVSIQNFDFPFFEENTPATLSQVTPTAKDYAATTDFATMTYSGSGDVTGAITPVDITIPPPAEPGSTSGCEATDFAGFTAGNVALVQRGTCDFGVEAKNAQYAGASAVLIFNEGQPGRTEALAGTLGAPGFTIPVIGTSYAVGEELAGAAGASVHVATDTTSETRKTTNVLADSPSGRPGRTVVVGSHLDSVIAGPGINDNGSGTSTDLAIAQAIKRTKIKPRNRIRFAFWGGEELGLLGSTHYVAGLSQAQRDQIAANLNFDMLASPNYARLIYDGDGSATPDDPSDAGPVGSDTIEHTFENYYKRRGLATEPTPFDGRSDYGPFIEVGIPAGGLFSGAEEVKTEAQAKLFGGVAGEAFDKCYHQACDTLSNLNLQALDELGDGATFAAYKLAMRKQPIYALKTAAKTQRGKTLAQRKLRKSSRSGALELAGSDAVR